MSRPEAVVVGAGPNGLSAAIRLAEAGLSVLVLEARAEPGGGATTAELTLPGFQHDVCSSVYPLAAGSPWFRTLPLRDYGLEWVRPTIPLAHPLHGEDAAVLQRDPDETTRALGADGAAWADLFRPFLDRPDDLNPEYVKPDEVTPDDVTPDALMEDVLAPLHWPAHPLLMARFGSKAIRSAAGLARARFQGPAARALLVGCAAHSPGRLDRPATAAIGLVLAGAAHAYGWPFARGGARAVTAALVGCLEALGGRIECSAPVRSLAELPPARLVMLDLTPRGMLQIAGDRLPAHYRRALERYRYGPGIFKIDWALDEPVPWIAAACRRAGTVHVGGGMDEIVRSERAVWRGEHAERPFVIMAQPSLFDPGRAPEGKHVAWGYCHVPNGSRRDMTEAIEATIERYAPGFRDTILARHTMNTADLAAHNANFVGGDIAGGAMTPRQLFFRPTIRRTPYRTPLDGVYLCSSSTPPGAGVHGMCGYHAAEAALGGH